MNRKQWLEVSVKVKHEAEEVTAEIVWGQEHGKVAGSQHKSET